MDTFQPTGTTLGADNGIGLCQILNILDDNNLKCNIEAVFTVSEETTMIGAEQIDTSLLSGKQLINLDGFEENTIIIESASFFDIILEHNYKFIKSNNKNNKNYYYKISISGLLGGHSGFDINKNRGNSCIILAELLKKIYSAQSFSLYTFVGGTKFNVIPSMSECIISCETDIINILNKITLDFIQDKKIMYKDLKINIETFNIFENNKSNNFFISSPHLNETSTKYFINSILDFKHGVFMFDKENYITTSINLGVVNLQKQIFKIGMRSSRKKEEEKCLSYIKDFSLSHNMSFKIIGYQPGFETNKNSNLVSALVTSYKKISNNDNPTIKPMHITVESGFFKSKIPELDVAIISPKILNAHTTLECVEISSIKKCDDWLINTIDLLK